MQGSRIQSSDSGLLNL